MDYLLVKRARKELPAGPQHNVEVTEGDRLAPASLLVYVGCQRVGHNGACM